MGNYLNILLIEDDLILAEQLIEFLNAAGNTVDYAESGKEGLRLAQLHDYDVVILDLTLPDQDGLEVCRKLKSSNEKLVPVLMLTARTALSEKLDGFAAGTDDYVTKPYQPDEILVRCVSMAKRKLLHQHKRLTIGELEVDLVSHRIARQGTELHLPLKESAILVELAIAHPMPVSRQALISKVWGNDIKDSDVLKSHIYTLRQKLDKPFSFGMLRTLHGVGFSLREKP